MRPLRYILPVLATLAAFASAPSHADPYRWCAQYGGGDHGGGRNCGFVTLEQCRATVRGMGGTCELNQFYTGPEPQSRKPRKRQRG